MTVIGPILSSQSGLVCEHVCAKAIHGIGMHT